VSTDRVLLLGGGRFVGRRLLHYLLEHGYPTDVLNRGLTMPGATLPQGAHHLPADRRVASSVRNALAGRSYATVFDTSGYRSSEVGNVLDVVEAGQYIYVSSVAVYPRLQLGVDLGPIAEDGETYSPIFDDDDRGGTLYAECKRGCEVTLLEQYRIPATIIRPCGIYGALDSCYRHDFFFDRLMHSRPVLVPEEQVGQRIALTFVDGLNEVCRLASIRVASDHRVLNVADSDAATCGDIIRTCANVAGQPLRMATYPIQLVRKIAGDVSERAMFPFPRRSGFSLDCTRAQRDLGWVPPTLLDGTRAVHEDYCRRLHRGDIEPPDLGLDNAILSQHRVTWAGTSGGADPNAS
jgi:nucleoside-diphosphate-sugar epimerase